MKTKKRILVAPLDWGIGHATRCIPIIKQLINQNYDVIIAADERPMHLLSNEFPKLEIIRFSGYNIKYPTYLPMSISMLLQIPKILWNIKKEAAKELNTPWFDRPLSKEANQFAKENDPTEYNCEEALEATGCSNRFSSEDKLECLKGKSAMIWKCRGGSTFYRKK